MKEQLDELIKLTYDYQTYGAKIHCKTSWIELYGSNTNVLPYEPDDIGRFKVYTYFADGSNYKTFILRFIMDNKEVSIIDYSGRIEFTFDVTEDFLKTAVEKLTVVLELWKEFTVNRSIIDIEAERQRLIAGLEAQLESLKNSKSDIEQLPF